MAKARGTSGACREGSGQAGIGKDLREFGEEHHDQGLDLVLVAGGCIRELCMQAHQFAIGSHLFAWHIARSCLPTQQRVFQSSSRRVGQSWLVTRVVDENDGFVRDVRDATHTRAAPTRDRDSPASREVASIPMRIWLGGASNWFSFSSQICQPSLALAKRIALFHHTFVGSTNAACTGLTSDINPADILERRFLRGSG